MRNNTAALLVCFLLAGALPALAHHSFAAEYDSTKPVTLTGVVSKFLWVNPHSRLYIDVKDETSGKVTNWEFEAGNPTNLQRNGWRRDTVKPGDVVIVKGYLAKDGASLAAASSISLPDGRKLFVGTPGDGSPETQK
jgi:hypothetical protein